jgi:hypothetical protein
VNRDAVAGSDPDTEPAVPLSTVVPAGSAAHAPTDSVDDGVVVAELVGMAVDVGVAPSDIVGVVVALLVWVEVTVAVRVAADVRVRVGDAVLDRDAVALAVVLALAPRLTVADADDVGDGIAALHVTPSAEELAPEYMPTSANTRVAPTRGDPAATSIVTPAAAPQHVAPPSSLLATQPSAATALEPTPGQLAPT